MIRTSHHKSPQWIAAELRHAQLLARLQELSGDIVRRPLADFVRGSDHFLPVSVLSLSVTELADISFEALRKFPGVGLVKIRNLHGLLERVLETPPPSILLNLTTKASSETVAAIESVEVSTIQWALWCASLKKAELLDEPLGRLSRRLGDLPRALWDVPISSYTALTLDALRDLKGYGPRRTAMVLEILQSVAALVDASERRPGQVVKFVPIEIVEVEAWLVNVLAGASVASLTAFDTQFVAPMVKLLRRELDEAPAEVVQSLLHDSTAAGVAPSRRPSPSRLHQLRRDAASVIRLRWPHGARWAAAYLACSERSGTMSAAAAAASRHVLGFLFPELGRIVSGVRRNKVNSSPLAQ
ncbi:MAG: hypothetical protein QM775_20580 [Pirellulales bacterium]